MSKIVTVSLDEPDIIACQEECQRDLDQGLIDLSLWLIQQTSMDAELKRHYIGLLGHARNHIRVQTDEMRMNTKWRVN